MPKTIILQIDQPGVRCSPGLLTPWPSTNWPAGHFGVKTHYPIFWEVEMQRFDAASGTLYVRVTDYEAEEEGRFAQQQPKKEIRSLVFDTLLWYEVEPHLSFYEPRHFDALVDRQEPPPPAPGVVEEPFPETWIGEEPDEEDLAPFIPEVAPATRTFEFTFPLLKCRFDLGYVQFEKKLKGFPEPVRAKIYHAAILPEFDHVKPFFAKAIGRRRIQVKMTLTLENGRITRVDAVSPDIARIDEATITGVKQLQVRELRRPPKVIPVDKSLFTSEDIFEATGEPDLGNTFRLSDRELLEHLLDAEPVRNRRQLEYLAGKLHDQREPLRFTLHPVFGFLFFVEGETMHHFIWELLDSHATYLWSLDKGPRAAQYRQVQERINFIRQHGRQAYKQHRPEDELPFNIVRHEKASSPVVDGFPLWRHRLEEKLV